MSECSKCKKRFEEINLIWIRKDKKTFVVCFKCKELLKKGRA